VHLPNPVNTETFQFVTLIGTNPAAGANYALACPANARIQPTYLGFIFTSSAAAANRYHTITVKTGSLYQTHGATATAQVASKTYGIAWVAGLANQVDLTAENILVLPMSDQMIIGPDDSLSTWVENIQAADSITSIICRYKLWILP